MVRGVPLGAASGVAPALAMLSFRKSPSFHADPTIITSLSITPSGLVSTNQDVDIVCRFEAGNPPLEPQLYNRLGQKLASNISQGVTQYRLSAVSCDEAGQISCEVPGANGRKTATLLVKCPPTFGNHEKVQTHVIHEGDSLSLQFYVRTHTASFEQCRLTKLNSLTRKRRSALDDCESNSTLNGTPPDFNLTVNLTDVRREDASEWRLMLENSEGADHTEFTLRVLYKADNETELGTEKHEMAYPGNIGLTVGIPVIVIGFVTIIVIIVAVVSIRRRGRCFRTYEEPCPGRGTPEESEHSQHIYTEPDDSCPAQLIHAGHCLEPDGYLPPVPKRNTSHTQASQPQDDQLPGTSKQDDHKKANKKYDNDTETVNEDLELDVVTRDGQRPVTKRQKCVQFLSEHEDKKTLFSAEQSNKADLDQPCTSVKDFHGDIDRPKETHKRPVRCKLLKAVPKESCTLLTVSVGEENISLIGNNLSSGSHISDMRLEGDKLHISLQLHQLSSCKPKSPFTCSTRGPQHGTPAVPDDYMHPVASDNDVPMSDERSSVDTWSSGIIDSLI